MVVCESVWVCVCVFSQLVLMLMWFRCQEAEFRSVTAEGKTMLFSFSNIIGIVIDFH